ncbi:MAG: UvrD-helicase domain-containing protein [Bacteroidales bacterium]|nr:UvrD-helicase domain-containing protein [Bacteroidales bacterium]
MDNSRFIICRAAAGSGKTYTLVRQYLQLAFSATESQLSQRFTHILAITFTNKAANEMKERILHELDNIATQGCDSAMGNDLSQRLNITDDTLRHHADIVRRSILHNYSDFAVCTIDSFMHRIVRTFAHDLNLPLNFDVHIDKDDLVQSAVDELMALAGTEGQDELTEMLCEFAESRMNDGKSYLVEHELATLSEELFKEQSEEYLEVLKHLDTAQFRDIQHQMIAANRHYEQQLQSLGSKALEIISRAGLAIEDFYYGSKGAGAFFRKLTEGSTEPPNSYATAYLEGDKLGGGKCSPATRDKLSMVKPSLQEVYQHFQQLYNSEGLLYNTRRLLLKNIYSLALLNKLGELVENYAHDNEIVHISEFNKRIADVVREEPTPFIYERLGNRYWNYLIDEFQDTSRMQWLNLVPLVENGVASDHTSLVVGDGKQAIYRFRQGDVDQFMSLPHIDNPLHGAIFEHPGISDLTLLNRNFRTGRTLVEFNNNFFEWAIRNRFADNAQLQQIYLGHGNSPDLAQIPVHEGGYLQIGFWDLNKEYTILWDAMLQDIRLQVDKLGYRYRDIKLLARNKSTLSDISAFLTSAGVPVVSSESFLLSQSQVVMLLRSLLQYLVDSNDRVAAARVIIYLRNLGIVRRDFSPHFLSNRANPLPSLDELLNNEDIHLRCDRLRQMGLYDCCEEALRMLHLDGLETAYTGTFLNVVAKYCTNHRQNMTEFLEWFDEQKDKLSTSTATDLDAVQLMTIHKAKGLEAPIIIYPIVYHKNNTDSLWVHIDESCGLPLPASLVRPTKDQHSLFDEENNDELRKCDMDSINVLYVALTRPREKLLVYCEQPKKEGGTDYPALIHDYINTRSDVTELCPQVYALGDNNPKQQSAESTTTAQNIQLQTLSYPDWASRIAIADQSSALFGELDETAKRRGNQLHELLSHIRHRNEVDTVLEHYLQLYPIDEEERNLLATTLQHMMQQPEVAQFFNPDYRCMNESSLVWQGEVLRPDRIVYTPTEIWVIDFKTGSRRNEHSSQVSRYCQAVAAITHSENVKGYLLYIDADHCQVLPCQ